MKKQELGQKSKKHEELGSSQHSKSNRRRNELGKRAITHRPHEVCSRQAPGLRFIHGGDDKILLLIVVQSS